MKTHLMSTLSGLATLALMGSCATTDQYAQAQEYDDMYFTANDRNTVEITKLNEPGKAQYDNKGSYVFEQKSYSGKNVNPDLIAQYENQEVEAEEEAAYYVSEFEREDYKTYERPQVVNNFYGRPYSTFGNPFYSGAGAFHDPFYSSFYDPFYSAYDPYGSFYDPFFGRPAWGRPGFRTGLSLSLAFGNTWGSPRWRNPYAGFRSPWGYDPFMSSYYNPYYSGLYNGYGYGLRPNNIVIINNGEAPGSRRLTTYGRSPMRSSRVDNAANDTRRTVRSSGRNASSREAVASERTRSSYGTRSSRSNSRESVTKSYNELNQRTRTRQSSDAYNSRNSSRATPATRSSRSYTPSDATRSSKSGSYTRTRSTRPSNNSNRSDYNRTRSRSSSGYAPSQRSSGSSYGTRSSGSNSRSSGSYSSGSSRSSGGSSRGSRGSNR